MYASLYKHKSLYLPHLKCFQSQATTSTSFQNFSDSKPWCDTRCLSLNGRSLLCQFRWYFGRTWSSRSNMSTIVVPPTWWKLYKVGRVSEYESNHHLIGIGFGIITYKESCEDCKPGRGGDAGDGGRRQQTLSLLPSKDMAFTHAIRSWISNPHRDPTRFFVPQHLSPSI